VKAGGPLGLSIVGGIDHTSHPFGVDNPGIFISKVRLSRSRVAGFQTPPPLLQHQGSNWIKNVAGPLEQ